MLEEKGWVVEVREIGGWEIVGGKKIRERRDEGEVGIVGEVYV